MKKLKEKITKKDLVYWIIIIVIIGIAVTSFYSGTQYELINRLSFAGIVTSIILAAIAIFIAVIQNYLYQNTSERLIQSVNKIEELNEQNTKTARKFDKNAEELSKSINNIEEIEKRTNNILTKVETNRSLMKKMKSTINARPSQNKISKSNTKTKITFKYNKEETVEIIRVNEYALYPLYYLYIAFQEKKELPLTYMEELSELLNSKMNTPDTKNITYGAVGISLLLFSRLGGYNLVEENNAYKVENFNNTIIQAIKEFKKEIEEKEEKKVKKFYKQ